MMSLCWLNELHLTSAGGAVASEVRLRKAVEMGLGSAMAENLKYAVPINRTKERKPN